MEQLAELVGILEVLPRRLGVTNETSDVY